MSDLLYRIQPSPDSTTCNYTINRRDAAFAAAKGKHVTMTRVSWMPVKVSLYLNGVEEIFVNTGEEPNNEE